jgi:kumamolisin
MSRVPLTGSEREPLPGARRVGDADPEEELEVTVVLRPRRGGRVVRGAEELGLLRPAEKRHLTARTLASARGADPDDVARVSAFARAHGLTVRRRSAGSRSFTLRGTAGEFSSALHVELGRWEHEDGSYRGRVGAVHLPAELEPVVDGIFGLDDRPQSHRRSRAMATTAPFRFAVPDVVQTYGYPDHLDGSGGRAAILQFGGGFRQSDVDAYFARVGMHTPAIETVAVAAGANAPGSPEDAEVLLDVEVLGAAAPGAELLLVFADNSERGWLEAVRAAVHAQPTPTVISISWGALESRWTRQAMKTLDDVFQDAALLGITICCSSGDHGSSPASSPEVAFPASSPHVLACGGTTLDPGGAESGWNDAHGATGGGYSSVFPRPSWQCTLAGDGGRAIPDVAGNADPGYEIVVNGAVTGGGGTSAVAPLAAALVLRLAQQLGRVGYVTPLLYADDRAAGAWGDVTTGDNGAYRAGRGWDAVTGWGSPRGSELLAALQATTAT